MEHLIYGSVIGARSFDRVFMCVCIHIYKGAFYTHTCVYVRKTLTQGRFYVNT